MGQALVALATPLVSRLYGPEEFGVLALFGSLMTPLGILATCRFETSIPLAKEDAEAQDLLLLCFGLALATALVVALILQVARMLGLSAAWGWWTAPLSWLLPLGMVAIGTYQSLSYWATRKQAFASVLTQVGAHALPPKGLGLLLGFVVGQGFGVRPLWLAYRRDRPGRMGPLLAGGLRVARGYGALSASGTLTALALALGEHPSAPGPCPLLRTGQRGDLSHGLAAVRPACPGRGRFGRPGVHGGGKPPPTGGTGDAPRLHPRAPPGLGGRCPGRVILGAFAPLLLPWILGGQWGQAGLAALALAPPSAAELMTNPFYNLTLMARRPRLQLLCGLLPVAAPLAVLVVAAGFGATFFGALLTYALARSLAYLGVLQVYHALAQGLGQGPSGKGPDREFPGRTGV